MINFLKKYIPKRISVNNYKMWKFSNSDKELYSSEDVKEVIKYMKIFRNVNMIAGGYDPFQDTDYTLTNTTGYYKHINKHDDIEKIVEIEFSSLDNDWEMLN